MNWNANLSSDDAELDFMANVSTPVSLDMKGSSYTEIDVERARKKKKRKSKDKDGESNQVHTESCDDTQINSTLESVPKKKKKKLKMEINESMNTEYIPETTHDDESFELQFPYVALEKEISDGHINSVAADLEDHLFSQAEVFYLLSAVNEECPRDDSLPGKTRLGYIDWSKVSQKVKHSPEECKEKFTHLLRKQVKYKNLSTLVDDILTDFVQSKHDKEGLLVNFTREYLHSPSYISNKVPKIELITKMWQNLPDDLKANYKHSVKIIQKVSKTVKSKGLQWRTPLKNYMESDTDGLPRSVLISNWKALSRKKKRKHIIAAVNSLDPDKAMHAVCKGSNVGLTQEEITIYLKHCDFPLDIPKKPSTAYFDDLVEQGKALPSEKFSRSKYYYSHMSPETRKEWDVKYEEYCDSYLKKLDEWKRNALPVSLVLAQRYFVCSKRLVPMEIANKNDIFSAMLSVLGCA